MSTPTEPITDPAAGNPAPDPVAPAATPPAEPAAQPERDDAPLGPPGEKALAEWKQRAKEAEKLSKDQAARLAAFEDAQKTEAEKLSERAAAAEERATRATRLAVASKVEALAAGRFADPQDAVDSLRPEDYVSDDGGIDTEAIQEALKGLLDRKPHWARVEAGPRTPQPDPSQGARPGGTPTLQQQITEAENAGNTRLTLALKTRQLREIGTTSK